MVMMDLYNNLWYYLNKYEPLSGYREEYATLHGPTWRSLRDF